MDTNIQLENLGIVLERQDNQGKEIEGLKGEVSKLKEDLQNIKVQQVKDSERIVTLFNAFDEIKDYIKEINEKIDTKKDSFKDAMTKLAMELIRYGILGGILFYFFVYSS